MVETNVAATADRANLDSTKNGKRHRPSDPFLDRLLTKLSRLKQVEDAAKKNGLDNKDNAGLCESVIGKIENESKVSPIVHGLLMKQKLPHTSLVLADISFRAGKQDDGKKIELNRTNIEEKWENDAFLFDDIGGDKLAAGTMIETGRRLEWSYSSESAKFAVKLLSTPAQMVGQGIEVTELGRVELVEQKNEEKNLVTRPESRGVVASAFARVARHSTTAGLATAITGAPGIGKSWTLIYALQQALLYENACVVFFSQKTESAYLFVRRRDVIYAWEMDVREPASVFCLLDSALALLDPIEAQNGGAQLPAADCAILYAASYDAAHFKAGSSKVQAKVEQYLGPPSVDQLLVILDHIIVEEGNSEEALKRAKDVNNLLRYVTDSGRYDERKGDIDTALRSLDDQNTEAILRAEGRSLLDNQFRFGKTVPGTLFVVEPKTCVASEDDDEDDPVADRMLDEVPPRSYDGEGINYETRVITVATERVYDKVLTLNRESIISFWGVVCCDDSARIGRKLEELFADDLKNPRGVTVKTQRCKLRSTDELEEPGKLTLCAEGYKFHHPRDHEAAWDILGVIFANDDTSAAMPDCFPVIGAAGPGRRVYHVTTGKNHTKKASGMLKLLILAGLLKTGPEGELTTVAAGTINYYWVVPPARFNEWTQKKVAKKYTAKVPQDWDDGSSTLKKRRLEELEQPAKEEQPKKEASGEIAEPPTTTIEQLKKDIEDEIAELRNKNWEVFRDCFHHRVKQFVLEMPLNPTFAF